jgi:hypothetical protein
MFNFVTLPGQAGNAGNALPCARFHFRARMGDEYEKP